MDSRVLEEELAPLLARRELWLLVSAATLDPYHRDRFAVLRDPAFRRRAVEAAALLAQEPPQGALGPGEGELGEVSPNRLFSALDAEAETLEATHRQLFGLTAISPRCPPCEIEYEPNADVTFRSQSLADVAGFYQAFGLQVSARAGERLDHITVEAEFLYLLLAKEAAAIVEQNPEGAEICRQARRKFFQEHAGWWLPTFCRLLSRAAPPGFYRELAALTSGLAALERVSLGLPPFPAGLSPTPSGQEGELDCRACESAR